MCNVNENQFKCVHIHALLHCRYCRFVIDLKQRQHFSLVFLLQRIISCILRDIYYYPSNKYKQHSVDMEYILQLMTSECFFVPI